MFQDFEPKEQKVIVLFFAFLMLGLVYFWTHPSLQDSPTESPKLPPPQDTHTSERYF